MLIFYLLVSQYFVEHLLFVFLNHSDALSIFDKEEQDQNLELYLTNPMKADSFKNEIQIF